MKNEAGKSGGAGKERETEGERGVGETHSAAAREEVDECQTHRDEEGGDEQWKKRREGW